MGDKNPNTKVASSLLALSSAAVLAVYAAGYTRTRAAADRFTHEAEARRPVVPARPAAAAAPAGPVEPPPSAALAAPVPNPTLTTAPPPEAPRKPKRQRSEPKKAIETQVAAAVPVQPLEAAVPVPPPVVEPAAPPAQAAPKYKDGTYYGWGTSRHGDIQAAVVIEDGRIASATIAQCLTRYSCNVIAILPPQVAQRQSPETDYVSGATQSTNAFYYAVVEALGKAKL